MYLIVGLGNPEPEYSGTRHNMGFDVINKIAKKYNLTICQRKFEGIYTSGIIENEKVILLKPQTYMNLSGKSIIQYKNFYKIPDDKLIVIYDDMDLDVGTIKIRTKGSAGTHNGMKSVIEELGTKDFARVRIGTGRPTEDEKDIINYVINRVSNEEYKKLENGIDKGMNAVISILKDGIDKAMNMYNGKDN